MNFLQPLSTLDYFLLHGSVRLDALADLYALDLGESGDATLSDLIRRLSERPESGDRVAIGPAEFVVVHAEDGEIRTAGLRFRPSVRVPLRHGARRRPGQQSRRAGHGHAFPWPKNARGGQRRSAGA